MDKTVLLVDDDDMLRDSLARGLRSSGFCVLTAQDTVAAKEIIDRISPDVMILDRMMVGQDGLTFLKDLRAQGNTIPTIMLTALNGPENRIDGLAGGADDYIDKPFQLRELVLRLGNLVKRTPPPASDMPNGLHFINDEFFITVHNGEMCPLGLSGEEKKLLHSMTMPMGNIVPAQPMVAKRLREKLNSVSLNMDVVTVRGRGYKLICPQTTHNTLKQDKK